LGSLTRLHFGSALYFAFIDVEEGQIVGFYVKENKGAKLSHKKGIQAADLLVGENVDVALAASIGEGPFHVLGDKLIGIYKLLDSMKIREAISRLNQNLLEKIVLPAGKHYEVKIE